MSEREDVGFEAEGSVTLCGWLLLPDGPGPHPAITMAHGYAGVKEHGLEPFARAFADDGFAVLLHDHRNFGASGGEPRHDVDPWRQVADWRRAISFLESRPEVNAEEAVAEDERQQSRGEPPRYQPIVRADHALP